MEYKAELKEDKIIDYAGGTAGISKQISEFCKNTSLLSALGQSKEYKKFLDCTYTYDDIESFNLDDMNKNELFSSYSKL